MRTISALSSVLLLSACTVSIYPRPHYYSTAAPISHSTNYQLVGLGCGKERLTMVAVEEDEFPVCDTIDTPANLCGEIDGEGEEITTLECAYYLGNEGW